MIAGWMRMVGHVTPTPTSIRSVEAAMAPSTDQTKGLWPWAPTQGWKWSEIDTKSNPRSSARPALATSARGSCSSLERV